MMLPPLFDAFRAGGCFLMQFAAHDRDIPGRIDRKRERGILHLIHLYENIIADRDIIAGIDT